MCPFELTGFAFSLYAVKLSSRQKSSSVAELELAGDDGEFGDIWEAVAMIPHMGHPVLGANSAILLLARPARLFC